MIEASFNAILSKLQDANGRPWKTALGEMHLQYQEMPFWILLGDAADLKLAHMTFRAIVAPYIPQILPTKITVSYHFLENQRIGTLCFISDINDSLPEDEPLLLNTSNIMWLPFEDSVFNTQL